MYIGIGVARPTDERVTMLQDHAGDAADAPGFLRWLLACFRPLRVWREVSSDVRRGRLRDTAWLDGLRGYASFLVYVSHHMLWSHREGLELAFGYDGYYFVTIPFVRTFFTGSHAAVSVFFVISGYVLSIKAVKLIHAGRMLQAAESLASSMLRRAIRLYVPVVGVSMTSVVLSYVTGLYPHQPNDFAKSIFTEFHRAFFDFWYWSYPFRQKSSGYWTDFGIPIPNFFRYNLHTWTIPVEYQGSMLVFTVLLMFSGCAVRWRLAALAGMAWYFLVQGGWYYSSFITGLLMAECDQLSKEKPLWPASLSKLRAVVVWASLVAGLYLAGIPALGFDHITTAEVAQQPGWGFIEPWVPTHYFDPGVFVLTIAAVLIVPSVGAIGVLRRFFELLPMQYLGRISFAFYLVHGPILSTVGDRLYHVVGRDHGMPGEYAAITNILPIPDWGPYGLELDFLLPHIVLLPLTCYVSEVVTKMWDEPSVNLARQVQTAMYS